jgi:hypothetical protein
MKLLNCLSRLILVVLVTGCATLSPEAGRLMTIRDGGVMAMMDCQQLGYVTGSAGIWGGTAGLDSAFTDAKNKAAQLPGVNAILVTSSRMNPTAFVNATAFNCSERKTQKIEIVNPPSQPIQQSKDLEETMRRARACQQHGGVWVNDQCVIDIK